MSLLVIRNCLDRMHRVEATPATILVVDDDQILREMIETMVDMAGYRVRSAEDGRDALDRVAEEMPRLILLDMMMPRMDGWQFAERFYALYGHACPIVVVTAAPDASARAEQIGADGFLDKPFTIEA